MNLKEYIKLNKEGVALIQVKVTPSCSKTEFFSILDNGILKIRLKAIPEKGKANKELIKFISKELKIDKSSIEIISGNTDKIKKIRILQK